MAQITNDNGQAYKDSIKALWYKLTDEEISCHEGLRDVFFMAVRKKHGLPRAQAEDLLRSMIYPQFEQVA